MRAAPAGNGRAAEAADSGLVLAPDQNRIHLKRGAFFRVREGAGRIITAHAGLLWITEQDSSCDVVLGAGESFTLARQGLALVEALRDASISLDPVDTTSELLL